MIYDLWSSIWVANITITSYCHPPQYKIRKVINLLVIVIKRSQKNPPFALEDGINFNKSFKMPNLCRFQFHHHHHHWIMIIITIINITFILVIRWWDVNKWVCRWWWLEARNHHCTTSRTTSGREISLNLPSNTDLWSELKRLKFLIPLILHGLGRTNWL